MASTAVVVSTLCTIVLFIVHIVGLATPHWLDITYKDVEIVYAGLFKLCIGSDAKSVIDINFQQCFDYGDASLSSADYYGFVGLTCVAGLLYFIGSIIGLIGCCSSSGSGRRSVRTLSGMAFGSGSFALAGIIWFAISFYNDKSTFANLTSESNVDLKLQYSFYLCAISGGFCVAFAITTCIVAQNMEEPPLVVGGIMNPACPQVTVVQSHVQNNTVNPGLYQPPTQKPYYSQPV